MSDNRLSKVSKLFLQISPTGKCDLRLAFDVIAYFVGDIEKHWPAIINFYNQCLPYIQDRVRYYVIDGREQYRRIEPDTFDLLPFWASADAGKRDIYRLTLHGGKNAEDASDIKFDFYYERADPGYVRLVLPIDFVQRSTLAQDVVALVYGFDIFCGTAGYAVSMRSRYASTRQGGPVYMLSRRFAGVDFGLPHLWARYIARGLKSVNWMTFLGKELVERVDGIDTLTREIITGITVHRLSRGVAVQAGEAPALGDSNRNESMELYRAANRLVYLSRFPIEEIGVYNEIGGEENTRAWLARFDD